MKKVVLLSVLVFSLAQLSAQTQSRASSEDRNFKIPLIGDPAPVFTAETTKGTLTFPTSYGNKWKLLFSHPQDYTPVCSSEIIELANMQNDFDELNAKIVIISTDNLETHVQWVKSLEELKYKGRQTQEIKFPLVDDNSKSVAKKYGMIHPNSNTTKDVRGVYIIDNHDVIQAILFYPMAVGRNMDEIKRTLIALQTTSKGGAVVTPANWIPGDDVMVHYKKTAKENEEDGLYDVSWYMTFKKNK